MVCLRKTTGNSSAFDRIHSHSFLNTRNLFEVVSHLMLLTDIWLGNSRRLNVGIHRRKTYNPTCFTKSPTSIVETDDAEAEAEPEVARDDRSARAIEGTRSLDLQHQCRTLFAFQTHMSLPTSSLHPSISPILPHSLLIPSRQPALNFLREACHNKHCSEGRSIGCGM